MNTPPSVPLSRKLDGWLLVFMAALIVTSLVELVRLGMAWQGMNAWDSLYQPFPMAVRLGVAAYFVANIVAPLIIFWRMLRVRRWSSIQFAVAGLWIDALGIPLVDFAYGAWAVPEGYHGLQHLVNLLLGRSIPALIASAYLLRSARAEKAYPRPDAPELLGELFE